MSYPHDFVWGAAAASYQVEGAPLEDGKGLSVWDMFSRIPGAVWNGDTGAVACDHYHRYAEDVALMKEMGLQAYRLSISWPRVLPQGTGAVNPAGLGFYDRLTDALLTAGVTPYITLFHWDYPYELFCRGGWLNPDSPDWFADYTAVVVERLSDRVRHWFTLNEPSVYIDHGHREGTHAPGLKLAWPEVLRAWHHTLLAHGKSVQVIRAHSKQAASVGAAPVPTIDYPASSDPADIEAARQATFAVRGRSLWNTTMFFDPVLFGQYPEDGLTAFGADMPAIGPQDMETIRQPLDFMGFNLYQGHQTQAGPDGQPERVPFPTGYPHTSFNWNVTPEALYWGARFLYERYQKPLYVTENGLANADWVALDGKVHDPQRIDFTRRYLQALGRAMDDGADVRGYFHWCLMDNFEWAEGYRQRFGLIYVDFPTQQRIPKDSAGWYREVIASNGAALD